MATVQDPPTKRLLVSIRHRTFKVDEHMLKEKQESALANLGFC